MSEPPGLPPPRPIPLKDRAALVFVERAQLDVEDGCFVAIDAEGVRTVIPVGGIAKAATSVVAGTNSTV
jgi:CRISPR-associated protein Cas1